MANTRTDTKKSSSRTAIIQTIQTPLGFFVLVVLVVEAIFGIVAALSSPNERIYYSAPMTAMLFLLVGIVTFLSYKRPEALRGVRADLGSAKSMELPARPLGGSSP